MIKRWLVGCCALLALTAGACGQEARFPSKLVRIISPYPPGGPTDIVARLLSPYLEKEWGQTVIVDNRSGGSGMVGAGAVATAPPDGHTMVLHIGSYSVATAVMKGLPFDPKTDLVGVTLLFSVPNTLIVPPKSPFKTVADVVAAAKGAPGKLNYGTAGIGTSTQLTAVMLEKVAGVSMQHVPFRGGVPAMEATMAGTVDMTFTVLNSTVAYEQAGSIRTLALAADKRSPALPDVPTFAEAGFKDIVFDSWLGLLAPAGTPKPVLDKIQQTLKGILAQPDLIAKLAPLGLYPRVSTPEEFQAQIKSETALYADLAARADLQLAP